MENRIKEQVAPFAERILTGLLRGHQMRLDCPSSAKRPVPAHRGLELKSREIARATGATARLNLIKIGAQ
jgi:hypothetical protein